jgi:hypothetical protein
MLLRLSSRKLRHGRYVCILIKQYTADDRLVLDCTIAAVLGFN